MIQYRFCYIEYRNNSEFITICNCSERYAIYAAWKCWTVTINLLCWCILLYIIFLYIRNVRKIFLIYKNPASAGFALLMPKPLCECCDLHTGWYIFDPSVIFLHTVRHWYRLPTLLWPVQSYCHDFSLRWHMQIYLSFSS